MAPYSDNNTTNNRHPNPVPYGATKVQIDPAFDSNVKILLSKRVMQAILLRYCVPEFEEASLEWICRNAFQGEPAAEAESFEELCFATLHQDSSEVPVPGVKARDFDMVYRARTPKGEELIINVEYQGDFYEETSAKRVNRAQFQSALLVSEQNGKTFRGQAFEKMQKSYSIWIYVKPTKNLRNGVNLTQFDTWRLYGKVNEQEFSLNNILGVYLDDPANVKTKGIVHFLSTLLNCRSSEKMVDIMKEYDIPTKYFDKEAAERMCTVSNGIYSWGEEKGLEKGMEKGLEKGKQDEQRHTIQILLDLGQTVEQIVHEFHYPETLVHEVVKEQLA